MYEGEWLNERKHGIGRLTRVDGSYYEGPWLNGNRHGEGVKKDEKGIVKRCEYKDDLFVKYLE